MGKKFFLTNFFSQARDETFYVSLNCLAFTMYKITNNSNLFYQFILTRKVTVKAGFLRYLP